MNNFTGTKWFVFGKGSSAGWVTEQFIAVPRVGATLPGARNPGTGIAPWWITQNHVLFGVDTGAVPEALGFVDSFAFIGHYSEYFKQASFLFNRGSTTSNKPLGWRCIATGSPGTWLPVYAPKNGEVTIAFGTDPSDANQTPTTAQNAYRTFVCTGVLSADRRLFLAVPASNDDGAEHVIDASGVSVHDIIVDLVGSPGTTVTIPAGKTAIIRTNTGGVKRQTADV
jgi:hypothetical protein